MNNILKAGGNLGTQGSASHNFKQLGVINIHKDEISEERILELAIESGADECLLNNDIHEIQYQSKVKFIMLKNWKKK